MQVWHSILHRAPLYVVVISSASSISARKKDIYAAKVITCPLIPKYSASDFSNKRRNPKRILASSKFQTRFGMLPRVKKTGWPDDFPSCYV
ncbi:hypothetical protein RhiirA4_472198 [Rhizophagus irregularis]|uniref:Uncharacterized protein n=1 Tax=Rhizophagus irregularis TaxID=588596 RepID=A0A2I1H4H8_9GLOM|nr:hypothetical protein RhiirA4_472198 [Rhizophagus irregularis]